MFGGNVNSKPEKCLKMPHAAKRQSPESSARCVRRVSIYYKYFLTISTPFIFSDTNPFFSYMEYAP